jgi:CubicO group peptidase (beta-lactamase class C family)
VPQSYIRAATTTHVSAGSSLGYGYFWWTYAQAGLPRIDLAIGTGGQFVIVAPSLDTVIVLTSSGETDPDATYLAVIRKVIRAVRPE